MNSTRLIKHSPGALGLRLFGLGPFFLPCKGMNKLKELLDKHAFWAKERDIDDLKVLLANSTVIVSVWKGKKLIGFGRATSDRIYRAVLWDIVVEENSQGSGLGRKVIEVLLSSKEMKSVEKVYLMTTNSSEFYLQNGFRRCVDQSLLIKSDRNWG